MSRSLTGIGSAVFACLLLTACDDVLVIAKLPPVQDDRIVGVWANVEDPDDLGNIEKSGDGYVIKPQEAGGKVTRFTLARAGDSLFAQIEDACTGHVFSFPGDRRTCYQVALLEFGVDSLVFQRIDTKMFEKEEELSVEYRIATSKPKRGDSVTCVLIESPAPDVLAFLAALPPSSFKNGTRMLRRR